VDVGVGDTEVLGLGEALDAEGLDEPTQPVRPTAAMAATLASTIRR
jgi:hypothetical protein